MAVTDWSTTPANNTSLASINLSEGATQIGDVNGIARQLMADIKTFSLTVPDGTSYVTKTGGTFTGNPVFSGRGGYLHHNNSALTGGRIFIQASGGAAPTMAAGDILLEY